MTYQSAIFDRAARGIGKVSMEWASIERGIDEFIGCLIPIKEERVWHIVCGNMDIRSKLLTAKGLVVHRNFDKGWTKAAVRLLEEIDNSLRSQRNYIIHSAWVRPNKKLVRSMKKTRLKRPQSYQLTLSTEDLEHFPPSKIVRFAVDLQNAWRELFSLFCYAMEWDDPETLKLPTLSYAQYLRLAGRPFPRRQRTPRQQPRPRSSLR